MNAIEIRDLSRSFGELKAVDRMNLDIAEGEIFGLVGPDGAGKTTTMRMLTGIMEPTSGTAAVAGISITDDPEGLKEQIGYMSQRFGLYRDLTVMENLAFYADIYEVPRKVRAERYERLLGFSNLTPFRDRLAGQLSGGMKQKLGLACALVHTPKVLFLDEPTNGVDPVSRRDFWRILYSLLKDGVTIFFSTAYLDEAERCSRLALMHKGHILDVGTPDQVKDSVGARVLELTLDDVRTARDVLADRFPGLHISLYGNRVHILTADPVSIGPRVTGALSDAGVHVESSREMEPLLEDVFIERTGSQEVQHES